MIYVWFPAEQKDSVKKNLLLIPGPDGTLDLFLIFRTYVTYCIISTRKKNHMQTYSRLEKRFRPLAKENINTWGKPLSFWTASSTTYCNKLWKPPLAMLWVCLIARRERHLEKGASLGVWSRVDTKCQRLTYCPSAYTESCCIRRGGLRNFPHP